MSMTLADLVPTLQKTQHYKNQPEKFILEDTRC
jgi:hypothetical protein